MNQHHNHSIYKDSTGSVMDDLSELVAHGACPPGTVVYAGEQTSGRGQRGRSWIAPPKSSLLMAQFLPCPLDQRGPFALLVAKALVDSLARLGCEEAKIKWPNDVLAPDGKKLAGILIEGSPAGVIVGLGVNLLQESFPPEVEGTSVFLHWGMSISPHQLLGQFMAESRSLLSNPGSAIGPWYKEYFYGLGSKVRLVPGSPIGSEQRAGIVEGVFAGVDSSGAIILTLDDGSQSQYSSGHLSLRF